MPLVSGLMLAAQLAGPFPALWPPQIERWRSLIEPNARRYHLDPALIAAMIQIESGGDPEAVRHEPLLGLDSIGLMQVVPFPWRGLEAQTLYFPSVNISVGAAILATTRRQADYDMRTALALYNCGDGLWQSLCGKHGGFAYADAVLALCREYGGCLPLPPFMERRR